MSQLVNVKERNALGSRLGAKWEAPSNVESVPRSPLPPDQIIPRVRVNPRQPQPQMSWSTLPVELTLRVLSFFDTTELVNFRRVTYFSANARFHSQAYSINHISS